MPVVQLPRDQARWLNPQVLRDANWTDRDAGNPAIALLSRNHEEPWLTGFGQNLPNGAPWQQFALTMEAPPSLSTMS